jgi:hypothetical protein
MQYLHSFEVGETKRFLGQAVDPKTSLTWSDDTASLPAERFTAYR